MIHRMRIVMPLAAVAVFAVWIASTAARPMKADVRAPADGAHAISVGEFDLVAFARLPVVYQGRTKPWDSLARNCLLIISDKQTFTEKILDPKNPKVITAEVRQPAIKWLLDVIARPDDAFRHEVFRIENDDVLDAMGLEPRAGFRYAFGEFAHGESLQRLDTDANKAIRKPKTEQTLYDTKIVELAEQVHLFHRLMAVHQVPDLTRGSGFLRAAMQYRDQLSGQALVHAVAPPSRDTEWQPFLPSLLKGAAIRYLASGDANPEAILQRSIPIQQVFDSLDANTQSLYNILVSYALHDPGTFNRSVAEYRLRLSTMFPDVMDKGAAEVVFNRTEPFYAASVIYGFVFVAICLAFLLRFPPLYSTAIALTLLAFAIHTVALCTRMYLQGRPPVTNLYSSAVFIGWGAVAVSLFMEWVYRNGIGLLAGAVVGALTLIVAHGLALVNDGDTMEMMQAVLDTNFWLATHVTTVTLGYTAVFLAGAIAAGYIIAGVFTGALSKRWSDEPPSRVPSPSKAGATAQVADRVATSGGRFRDPAYKVLGRMIYGVLCFALFLSFTGTVLGGIWADQSWGRFWGWDAKENGALMIVLWVAMILHARWGGLIAQRGIAVLAVLGNIIVAWSWFGVNMLGVGLHTYGFMDAALPWLLTFVASQLVIALIGCLPMSLWRSFNGAADADHTPSASPAPA